MSSYECIHCQRSLFFTDRLGYWTDDNMYNLGVVTYELRHAPDMSEVIDDLRRTEESLR